MSALSIKLFNQELNFLKNIFRSYDTSPNDITADDMKMKSLQEDDAELDTGQDVLTLDEFVLNPPGYIPSSNSSFTSLPVQMEVLDSNSIKQIQNFYRKIDDTEISDGATSHDDLNLEKAKAKYVSMTEKSNLESKSIEATYEEASDPPEVQIEEMYQILSCRVKSRVKWFKDGEPLNLNSNGFPLNVHRKSDHSEGYSKPKIKSPKSRMSPVYKEDIVGRSSPRSAIVTPEVPSYSMSLVEEEIKQDSESNQTNISFNGSTSIIIASPKKEVSPSPQVEPASNKSPNTERLDGLNELAKLKVYDKSASQKNREVDDNIQKNTQDIASQSNLLKEHTENINSFISNNEAFNNHSLP